MNQLPEAAEEFQKAIDLVPEHPMALPNLSIVLAKMKNYHDAGEVARRALKVVPGSGRIHYILAVSMLAEHGNLDEIIAHLERAATDVPSAHLTAAELLAQRGRSPEAIRHLEEYLAGRGARRCQTSPKWRLGWPSCGSNPARANKKNESPGPSPSSGYPRKEYAGTATGRLASNSKP